MRSDPVPSHRTDVADLDRSREKQALREVMRRVRAALTPEERTRLASQVEKHMFGLPQLTDARTVLLFYSFGTEIPTAGMVERLLSGGRRVLLPYLSDEGAMEAAELVPGQSLVHSGYGPKEPSSRVAVEPSDVDLVVTPGLAFDRAGRRLGYGGGHYDRYLRRLSPHALRVGIGFAAQLVDEVPSEPGDERVDVVVTDRGVVDCRSR